MKTVLVYLSYTGNTKILGEAIRKGILATGTECDFVSLRKTDPESLQPYDLIGIGSPVRLGTLPAELKNFIVNMNFLAGKHCFVFNTHAALPVNFMRHCVQALTEQGLKVIGFKDWYCSVFLPYVPKPYFTDGHPDEIDLQEAEEFGKEIIERSDKIRQGADFLIQKLPEGKEYEEIYGGALSGGVLPIEVMQARAQGFKIDLEKCTRCGFCESLCPTNSIDFSSDPPVFRKCDQCWLCEQTCPAGAIFFNYPPLHRSHNEVVKRGFVPHLRAASAAGRFRQLVRDEDIGWDTPLFKIKNPPRFKLVDEEYYWQKAKVRKHQI